MAIIARQPFAPLDGARLQNLTSLKNRQNAIVPTAGKRKAEFIHCDDAENVDPLLSAKRTKSAKLANDVLKSANFILTKKTPLVSSSMLKPSLPASLAPRQTIKPKSPSKKLNTAKGVARPSSLSAPAGRSPTRASKRSGLLSTRRRNGGSCSRLDGTSSRISKTTAVAAPFSLDAALKGTIPNYVPKRAISTSSRSIPAEPDMKASWFFDIHEDTPEQEMTNMLQHGTCVLDISSDEECEKRARRDGREDKENVPPADDISQTSRRSVRTTARPDEMVIEKERVSLGELNRKQYYADGCDELSVFIIPGDEEELSEGQEQQPMSTKALTPVPVIPESKQRNPSPLNPNSKLNIQKEIDALMARTAAPSSTTDALLPPIEGAGESFEVWESGSAKDEEV